MSDRKNLISDFEYAVRKADAEGWDFVDLTTEDGFEILDMLKAQEPRVLTLEEVRDNCDAVWLEIRHYPPELCLIDHGESNSKWLRVTYGIDNWGQNEWSKYNWGWRCWTSRPTDEQREATPWQD